MRRLRLMAVVVLVGMALYAPWGGGLPGRALEEARADSTLSVYPATTVTGTATAMVLTGVLPSTLSSGSYTVDVGLDVQDTSGTVMSVPSSIPVGSITVGGQAVSVYYAATSGHHVILTNIALAPSGTLQVSLGVALGLRPLTDGTHYVSVTVSLGSTIIITYSGTYQSSGASVSGALTVQAVTMDSSVPGSPVALSFDIVSGSTLYPSDTIMIQFPAGFTVPGAIPVSAAGMIEPSLGKYVNSFGTAGITVSGSLVTLTVPQPDATVGNNASYFDASTVIGIRFGITAGFKLPATAGTYTFKLWTSRQTTPAAKTVTLGTGITSAQLSAAPLVSGAGTALTGSFTTSASGALAAGTSTLNLTFPTGWRLPAAVPAGVATVNGQPAQASVAGQVLKVAVPAAVPASSSVTFAIPLAAGLVMPPPVAGGYVVSLSTSSDAIPVPTSPIVPLASTVSHVVVSDTPAVHGAQASLAVTFTTGAGGALKPGDAVTLVLPAGFVVPVTLDRTAVVIRVPSDATSGAQPAAVQCDVAGRRIVVTLPAKLSVPAQTSVSVALPSVFTNPSAGGTMVAQLSTTADATPVDSDAFTVFNTPASTMSLSPARPDGKAGIYLTQPSFTLAVDGPSGLTLSAFYRIDESGSFASYDLKAKPAVKVPDGKHVITYYAQDSLGNVEPQHSQQVVVELQDPAVSVSSPAAGAVVVQPTITLTGKATAADTASLQVTVDGKAVSVGADGSFTAPVSFEREGDNAVTVVAVSASGRTTTLTVPVKYVARVTMSLVIGSTTANINNEFTTLEAAPFISKKGVTMVPLRFISEAFKAAVAWDPVFKTVTIALGGKTMRIQVGTVTADIGGTPMTLQDAPVIVKGRTFVPLRFIAENFGAKVDWNADLKMVSIVYPKP